MSYLHCFHICFMLDKDQIKFCVGEGYYISDIDVELGIIKMG